MTVRAVEAVGQHLDYRRAVHGIHKQLYRLVNRRHSDHFLIERFLLTVTVPTAL
jgi:hypothetical protein